MKKFLSAVLITCAALSLPAAERRGHAGIGLILGDPTGLTGKYWMDENTAVDAAAAWSLDEDRLNLHADYLRHEFARMRDAGADWAFHYGIGARFRFADNEGRDDNGDASLGARVPLGLDFYPDKTRLEFFVELAPVLDLVPDSDFDLEFGIGARFLF